MVDLGCQDTNWVGGNDKEVLDAILLRDALILALTKKNVVILSAFLVGFGPFGSQMVELGCQDTDWVGRNDKEVLDAI